MSTTKGQGVVLCLAMAAGASTGYAFTAAGYKSGLEVQGRAPSHVLRPTLTAPKAATGRLGTLGDGATVKTDAASGAVRVVSGRLDRSVGLDETSLVKACRAYLGEHPEITRASGSELALDRAALLIDAEDQLLKFDVVRDGRVIEDASVDCRFKAGTLIQVVSMAFDEAQPDLRVRRAPSAKSLAAAFGATKATLVGAKDRVVLEGGAYRRIGVSEFQVTTADTTYVVQVEEATGEVFDVRDTRHYTMGGQASLEVYPRWWGETVSAQPFSEGTVKIGNGTTKTDGAGAFAAADGTTSASLAGLAGTRANVRVKSGSLLQVPGSVQDGSVLVAYRKDAAATAMSDKNMAQAMAYFHVNKVVNHAKKYIAPTWFDRALTVNTNLSQTCNAFWDGSSVNFYSSGNNCANTALSADVVYHEWGHGLDANTGGISDSAFSEGYGDIVSMIFSNSPELGKGFRANGNGIRDLDNDNTYPRDQGEVHFEGLIIGGTFYHLYQALQTNHTPEEAFDLVSKYTFKMIYTARRYTDVYDAVLALDDDDGNLGNDTPNFCAINRAFTRHGLATADSGCTR
jgi:hypothetical protein